MAGKEIETQWPDQRGRVLATQHEGYVGVEALVQQWRDHAALFRRYRQVLPADWLEDRAAELGAALQARDQELVTLSEAARISNYSPDHLRRLHRQGRLTAMRKGRRLFFRVGDLPRKPTLVDDQPRGEYDPSAHARQVAIRRPHGGSHDTQEAA